MRVLLIVVLSGLMHAARSIGAGVGPGSAGTSLAFGYLLLTAFLVGGLFSRMRLPKLTGYLAAGIAVGPAGLALIDSNVMGTLEIVSGAAVALIALSAGSELELQALRPLARSIAWLAVLTAPVAAGLMAAGVYAARAWLPFMSGMSALQAAAIALVLGVVAVAKSPAVVMGLKKEMEADGPLAQTVLAVVVVSDLAVILLFSVTAPLARATLGAGPGAAQTLVTLAWELPGSLVAGLLMGLLISIYIRKVSGGVDLFVLTVCFVVAEVGVRLDLNPLLAALAAGIFSRNLTASGERLRKAIDGSSLPVYVLFFAVAGATIHLDVLAVVGGTALLLVAARAGVLLAGARLASGLAGAPEAVRRYAGLGLLPQAGLALALSVLLIKSFPEFGDQAGTLMLGVVAINEIVAPALYRYALVRSGEARAES